MNWWQRRTDSRSESGQRSCPKAEDRRRPIRITNLPGANLDARSAPVGCRPGMACINQPPTRGFSVNRFGASGQLLEEVALAFPGCFDQFGTDSFFCLEASSFPLDPTLAGPGPALSMHSAQFSLTRSVLGGATGLNVPR